MSLNSDVWLKWTWHGNKTTFLNGFAFTVIFKLAEHSTNILLSWSKNLHGKKNTENFSALKNLTLGHKKYSHGWLVKIWQRA